MITLNNGMTITPDSQGYTITDNVYTTLSVWYPTLEDILTYGVYDLLQERDEIDLISYQYTSRTYWTGAHA